MQKCILVLQMLHWLENTSMRYMGEIEIKIEKSGTYDVFFASPKIAYAKTLSEKSLLHF